MKLRTGITTGACAAAAAKAAVAVLCQRPLGPEVELRLPSGQAVRVPILYARPTGNATAAVAAVRKDAGDDADVTHGMEIRATVSWNDDGCLAGDHDPAVTFVAGEGVGTVTKPGLQIAPGEPAINPVPRQMIAAAIREITQRGVRVEIAIPGGRELAAQTFNPRLGIVGGLSILGTTGIVRPYCVRALRDALKCELDVAGACGVQSPVLVPGNIGAQAARQHFVLGDEQVIEAGNEWAFLLDTLADHRFQSVLLLGHPGKLAKLAEGHWDTHSSRSPSAVALVRQLCATVLQCPAAESPTVEGIFAALAPSPRRRLGDALAGRIRAAASDRLSRRLSVAVLLVDMAGHCLGTEGDLAPWQ